jgi:hypothetical protein
MSACGLGSVCVEDFFTLVLESFQSVKAALGLLAGQCLSARCLAITGWQGLSRVVTIDKSGANTAALASLNADKPDEETITVRQSE